MQKTTTIILSTLNARFIHASLGLRYLLANMGELRSQTRLVEYTVTTRAIDIAEDLLLQKPKIIGLGVYIWNAEETLQVVRLLKTISPQTIVVLGGPEVTYEVEQQEITSLADYVITGQGDLAFNELCQDVLGNRSPLQKVIRAKPFKLEEIRLPYDEYTDEDILNRVIYVEASRGCPFKCEFCLSSLDKTVYPFNLEQFLEEMQKLYDRGVRSFKFIDRTFNLKIDSSIRIMEFFLDKMQSENVYLHFELIPDHLPEKLKATIQRFPQHSLQFEIGIQSLNPEVQTIISRKQDNARASQNLRWIREQTSAHIHADLIIGLPGEDVASFASGFNQLVAMNPHEIQVGILKRLRGTPIIRHTRDFDMRYSLVAPYEILSNKLIPFETMQQLKRFARYWDMIANSGRFKYSKAWLLGDAPFLNFSTVCNWLYIECGQTHHIALPRLFSLLFSAMTGALKLDTTTTTELLLQDFAESGIKGQPKFMQLAEDKGETPMLRRSESRQKRHRINN